MDNLNEIKDFIVRKSRIAAEIVGDRLPEGYESDGEFAHCLKDSRKELIGEIMYNENCGWTGGFWVGIMNFCYLFSNDKVFFDYADKSRFRFMKRLYENPETLDHDIGFLYLYSEYARYKLRGDEEALKNTIVAADWLLKRYNEKGKFIQAWNVWRPGEEFSDNNRGRIIIDCMYNLPILFLASKHTGDKKYYEAAVNHANTCMKHIVRDDYTTNHTFVLDPDTGEPRFAQGCQGYSDDSCWSRGQSWAIGGFAMAYKYTGDEKYLEVAKGCAKVFINMLEENYLPKWDFVFKGRKDMPLDSSAAAIASSGLYELSNLVSDDERDYYRSAAERLIDALWKECTIKDDRYGLITHVTGHYTAGVFIDTNMIFGDLYFVEAVACMLGIEKFM